MKICIAGKNQIAIDALKYLIENNILPKQSLLGCINSTDNGINEWQPSFKYFCLVNNVKLLKLEELYLIEDLIFISLEFDKIIKPELFKTKKLFNIHFSLLPKYKGMYTSIMPILYDERKSGVTLHKIDAGIDTGEIINQISFNINLENNSHDLYRLYLIHSFELFKNNILDIIEDKVHSTTQPLIGSSYFSKKAIDFHSVNFNFNQTAYQINQFVRGYAFRPYQLPQLNGSKIIFSKILNSNSINKPGILIHENQFCYVYSTIDFDIELYKDMLENSLIAAEKGDLIYLNKLLLAGYNLEEKNSKGWNIFIVAAYHEQIEICNWLVKNGFDCNVSNNNGTTLLMYAMTSASKSNNLDLLDLLIRSGAELYKTDFKGKNIFDYALQYGNQKIISFLNNYK